jgi:hypothetical protein
VIGIVYALFAKSSLAEHVADEELPAPAVSSPDEVVRYAQDTAMAVAATDGSRPFSGRSRASAQR